MDALGPALERSVDLFGAAQEAHSDEHESPWKKLASFAASSFGGPIAGTLFDAGGGSVGEMAEAATHQLEMDRFMTDFEKRADQTGYRAPTVQADLQHVPREPVQAPTVDAGRPFRGLF